MKSDKLNLLLIKIRNAYVLWFALIALTLGIIVAFVVMIMFKSPDYTIVHNEIAELSNAVHSHYQKRPDYWGLNNQKAAAENIIPEKMRRGNQIFSSIGREIIIGSNPDGDTVMPGGRQFMLTVNNISYKICVALVRQSEVSVQNPSLQKMLFANENSQIEFGWGGEHKLKDLPHSAKDICKNRNSISWEFD